MTAMHDDYSQGYSLTRLFPRVATFAKHVACELWSRRQMAKSIGALSNQTLQDIGMTPDDLHILKSLSLAEDAAQSLAEAANRRSGNW